MELAGKHFGAEGVDCVRQGTAALSTLTAKPSNDTNQTGLPLLWSPILLPLISLHAQQLPSDMVMHPRLHTTF